MVSVIIPAFNVQQYIDQCLQSVTEQTYRDLEIILINDGSTDGTEEHCLRWAGWDSRIHYISKTNEGMGATRNHGLSLAQGEYILFVDADDWLETECIEKMYRLLEEEEAEICMSEYYKVTKEDKRHKKYEFLSAGKLSDTDRKKLMLFSPPSVWGKLYRHAFLAEISYEQPSCVYEDAAIYPYVISQAQRICCVYEPLCNYREDNEGSIMHKWKNFRQLPQAFAYSREKLQAAGCLKQYHSVLEHIALHNFALAYYQWKDVLSREDFTKYFEKPFGQFLARYYPEWRSQVYTHYFIWGSFALRWLAVSGMLRYANMQAHYPFSSIISQFMGNECEFSVEHPNLFRQHAVNLDLQGKCFEEIARGADTHKLGAIFIDFMEERYSVRHLEGDVYITQSEAFLECGAGCREYRSEMIPEGVLVESGSVEFMQLWKESCTRLVKYLKENLPGIQVILVRSRMAEWYGANGKQKQFTEIKEIRRFNQMFAEMEEYFLKIYPEVRVIELPDDLLYSDINGKYGCECWYWNRQIYKNQDLAIRMLPEETN